MAGGGYGRGAGIPLRERRRAGTVPAPPVSEATQPARHCWVLVPAGLSHAPAPALLLEWRRAAQAEGWEGRVVYAAQNRPNEWATVEEWLHADMLTTEEIGERRPTITDPVDAARHD